MRETPNNTKRPQLKTVNPTRGTATASSRSGPPRGKKRRRGGIRIGGVIIRPRFILLLLAITVLIGVVIGNATKPPDCYEISYSSIVMHETADAVLIKNEYGYSYPEESTLVWRLPDGSKVEIGDVVAVVRTLGFNEDWYAQLEIARRNTIEYMVNKLPQDDAEVWSKLDIIESNIELISSEMLKVISHSPERYKEFSEQLTLLYTEKKNILLAEFNGDRNLDDYLSQEELIQNKIDQYTVEVVATSEGILSYNTDGYANLYNYDSIESVTSKVFDNILEDSYSSAVKKTRGASDFYISDMSVCYIAMKGTGNTFKYLDDNDEAIIRINDGSLQYMAVVKSVSHDTDSSYIIVEPEGIFDQLYRERSMTVTVQKTWTGLVIPKEHIVRKQDRNGVYVYEDGKKRFEPIDILSENDEVVVLNTDSVNNVFKRGMLIVKQ